MRQAGVVYRLRRRCVSHCTCQRSCMRCVGGVYSCGLHHPTSRGEEKTFVTESLRNWTESETHYDKLGFIEVFHNSSLFKVKIYTKVSFLNHKKKVGTFCIFCGA